MEQIFKLTMIDCKKDEFTDTQATPKEPILPTRFTMIVC